MTIRPLKDRVLLRVPTPNARSEGGIWIDCAAMGELQDVFTVLSVGPQQSEVKRGDRVLCNSYAGTKVTVDDKPARLVDGSSILAIL